MNPQHAQAVLDMQTTLETAARHIDAYDNGTGSSYEELHRAVMALSRLVSRTESLLGPLAEELVGHQTDRADALGELYGEVVGDREYGIEVRS